MSIFSYLKRNFELRKLRKNRAKQKKAEKERIKKADFYKNKIEEAYIQLFDVLNEIDAMKEKKHIMEDFIENSNDTTINELLLTAILDDEIKVKENIAIELESKIDKYKKELKKYSKTDNENNELNESELKFEK